MADSLHVTCGLTAYTPESAPGPTLGNEYRKISPFTFRQDGEAGALVRRDGAGIPTRRGIFEEDVLG